MFNNTELFCVIDDFFLNLKRKPQLFKSLKYKEDNQI